MIHLNGNVLCAIDCETTGLDSYIHSIWQFTCLPLNSRLDPDINRGPFDVMMVPTDARFDTRAISEQKFNQALAKGLPAETTADLFHEWFERLNLGFKKRIIPLAHNWPFDRSFVDAWLGHHSFEYYFDPRYRDTMALACSISDACDRHAERVPFTHYPLRRIATALEIEWDSLLAHNSLYDAHKTVEVYKRLIQQVEFIS